MSLSRRSLLVLMTSLPISVLACQGANQPTAPATQPASLTPSPASAGKGTSILNVSYSATVDLYKELDAAFAADWKAKNGETVTVKQSHGASGSQARSVIDGLEADIVTLALAPDVDAIQQKGLIDANWQSRLANKSTPYFSTIVFLVRQGNPKGIKDWNDLIKSGVSVVTPNPKVSGGARWNFLAAWAYALKQQNGDDAAAKTFVSALLKNVPVLDSSASASTVTFTQHGVGDALLAWENEAQQVVKGAGAGKYEVVAPSLSIRAEPPVALVDKVVDKHDTRKVAQAYLDYLYTADGQKICAKNFYRPTDNSVAKTLKSQFPDVLMVTIDDTFGGWAKAQKAFFADGGIFDQIYQPKG